VVSKIYPEKRRDQPRLPARMQARIISAARGSPAPCVVREISPAGAKLDVDKNWALPKAPAIVHALLHGRLAGRHQCRRPVSDWARSRLVGSGSTADSAADQSECLIHLLVNEIVAFSPGQN
jgi:hypothetical protein